MAEIENRTAEMSMVFFRPRKSDIMPATSTPMIEPMRAHPTYQPSPPVVRPNCDFTTSVVPEMTAVSYPNRIPPRAATMAMKTVRELTLVFIVYLVNFLYLKRLTSVP